MFSSTQTIILHGILLMFVDRRAILEIEYPLVDLLNIEGLPHRQTSTSGARLTKTNHNSVLFLLEILHQLYPTNKRLVEEDKLFLFCFFIHLEM